jgi:hypothetical protein
MGGAGGAAVTQWPESDSVYAVQGWTAGQQDVEQTGTAALVTREFRSTGGTTATLTVVTSPTPKLYGPGPEVPFLGTGYTVERAPADLGSDLPDGIGELVAERGEERWIVVYAYGESRGFLGNGPVAWALALTDGVPGRPYDYFKLYLMARTDGGVGPDTDREVVELARTVFPHIASWYAR